MTTYRNDRNGQTVESTLTDAQACERFLCLHPEPGHWLKFWLHKYAQNYRAPNTQDTATQPNQAITFLCDWFTLAVGYGLKNPSIRAHFQDRRFRIKLSARGTLCLYSGALAEEQGTAEQGNRDPHDDREYIGCFLRGRFLQARQQDPNANSYAPYRRGRRYYRRDDDQDNRNRPLRELLPTEQMFLDQLSANPVGFLAECSKDMGQCCYCGLPLEDVTSKALGYGPICAKRYGLPWKKGADATYYESAPNFARSYNSTASQFCEAIRADPTNESTWLVFGDWLMEQGLPACKAPKGKPKLARADSQGAKPITYTPTPSQATAPAKANGCCNGTHTETPLEDSTHAVWLQGQDSTYTAEISSLPEAKPCPKCGETILRKHQVSEQKSYDETTGWTFKHPCGATLVILND